VGRSRAEVAGGAAAGAVGPPAGSVAGEAGGVAAEEMAAQVAAVATVGRGDPMSGSLRSRPPDTGG